MGTAAIKTEKKKHPSVSGFCYRNSGHKVTKTSVSEFCYRNKKLLLWSIEINTSSREKTV